jgi:hypothetical protein
MHNLLVASSLAANAPGYAGKRVSPRLGNFISALDAFFRARSLGQTRPRALNAIDDSVLDLI